MIADAQALATLFNTSGPAALVACVFAAMWWFERKEVKMLQSKVIKLSAVLLAQRNSKESAK